MKLQKTFVIILAAFFAFLFLFAPINYLLVQKGIVDYENVGNIIEVEKVYEEGEFGAAFFNQIEEIKRTVKDIYINYLPWYVETTLFVKDFKGKVNAPTTTWLTQLGDKIIKEQLEARKKNNTK